MDRLEIAKRMRTLREGIRLSQGKLAKALNVQQPLIAKYESATNIPMPEILVKYADFFDVSLDYLLDRTDKPQGKLYSYNPETIAKNEQMQEFIEMCFDPNSSVNAKLKESLIKLLSDNGNK